MTDDGTLAALPQLPPPDDLAEAGEAFWVAFTENVTELSPAARSLLVEVCRTHDAIEALQAEVAGGVMSTGSQGQEIVNPAVLEARNQRAMLHRLLAALSGAAESGGVKTARSIAGSQNAEKQWDGKDTEVKREKRLRAQNK